MRKVTLAAASLALCVAKPMNATTWKWEDHWDSDIWKWCVHAIGADYSSVETCYETVTAYLKAERREGFRVHCDWGPLPDDFEPFEYEPFIDPPSIEIEGSDSYADEHFDYAIDPPCRNEPFGYEPFDDYADEHFDYAIDPPCRNEPFGYEPFDDYADELLEYEPFIIIDPPSMPVQD